MRCSFFDKKALPYLSVQRTIDEFFFVTNSNKTHQSMCFNHLHCMSFCIIINRVCKEEMKIIFANVSTLGSLVSTTPMRDIRFIDSENIPLKLLNNDLPIWKNIGVWSSGKGYRRRHIIKHVLL